MNVLIVERQQELGQLWKRHLLRQGLSVDLVTSQNAAIEALCCCAYDLIVLDLVLEDGGALSVADFASYRRPEARVIFVTNTSFFGWVHFCIQRQCLRLCAKRNAARGSGGDGGALCDVALIAAMRFGKVQNRVDRDDPVRIDAFMTVVIMANDMVHVHRVRNIRPLIQLACISP